MKIYCIGAALVDETFTCIEPLLLDTSNPSHFNRTAGGVSYNIAHHLSRLGNEVELITHFGNDTDGKWLVERCIAAGIGISHAIVNEVPTGRYMALVQPDGNLFAGASAMHFEELLSIKVLDGISTQLREASFIQADCNLHAGTIEWIIAFCKKHDIPCAIDPVSVSKAQKLQKINLDGALLLSPNSDELFSAGTMIETEIELQAASLHKRGVKYVWVREGKKGSRFFTGKEIIVHTPRKLIVENVTGAGDAALAGWIHFYLKGKELSECVNAGHAMAELILQSNESVLNELTEETISRKLGE